MKLADTNHNGGAPAIDHDRLRDDILGKLRCSLATPNRNERLWLAFLGTLILAGAGAYIWQCTYGLQVTGMREYVFWGVYMTNFVFFIGVSHAGTLISAILRVTGAEWRRSITRMAEAITVFALMIGAPMVIIDMGRPDRVLNVIIHGRMNSPILWDVCSICTYMSGSLLYLYVAMIPDFALLAPRAPMWERRTLRQRLFQVLSLGYRDTPEQRRLLEKALATMAVIIIPVAISVHTVVSWIFGMTLRPGWHSTIFGPYFVIGAIFSGTAGIITAMVVFRKVYHLENFLTERQFKNLGRLMLALNLLYIYFTLAEYLTAWYGAEESDHRLLNLLMGHSPYGVAFWTWASLCLFLPALIVMLPLKESLIPRLLVASIIINIGMWVKRYLIIVPTLMTPYIAPEAAGVTPSYMPTWVEWTVTLGGLATFLMLFTLFAKFFPIISVWETVEGVAELGAKNIGVDLDRPLHPPPRRLDSRRRFAMPAAVAILFLVGLAFGTTAFGAATNEKPVVAASAARVEIAVASRDTDEGPQLAATVRLSGQPLAGAEVEFFVRRALGRLSLGTQATGADGVAMIPSPSDLPGRNGGELEVIAEIKSPAAHATQAGEATIKAGQPAAITADPFPRALWSPHAPLGLVFTFVLLLGIVWSTYSFVIVQLIRIRKAGNP
ncbi:MAG: NrfD/PsrC family molybdoenzyme membrane anchor subunit [Opitutaceae bacterium]|nr:NrfD/PsrC family molybdoenzyme membrane anchor subunit [Opitutaceae bacterium]